jgi:hypothetical protein
VTERGRPAGLSSSIVTRRSVASLLPVISLFFDIAQGAGLAGASGVRPFLPPLLAGALARGDIGLDFDGTDWSFLESPAFLAAVLALAVAVYLLGRSGANLPLERALGVVGVVLGALLFAGSLAAGGEEAWPGLLAGAACAGLGFAAAAAFLGRAGRRLDAEAAGFLALYAEAGSLFLAGLAILWPPLGLVGLVLLALLLLQGRRREAEKYEGLRILR